MAFACFGRRISQKSNASSGRPDYEEQAPPAPPVIQPYRTARSQVQPLSCRYFTYRELEVASRGWSAACIIGDGGFGRVYRGTLSGGREIAIKRLDRHGLQGDKEFNVEVSTLSRLQHPSIVSLLGICVEGDQRIAVFELMQRGSLSSALHHEERAHGDKRLSAVSQSGPPPQSLPWKERVQIALDVAQGLEYLHKEKYVHRDITSGNVLLKEAGHACLADFGLAHQLPTAESTVIGSALQADSVLMGTFGYMAPEYTVKTGEFSQKSDVYAYGVVLLELLTGRPAVDGSRPNGCQLLAQWLLPSLSSVTRLWEHVDPSLDPSSVPDPVLAVLAEVALICLAEEPSKRPHMKEVVAFLEPAAAYKGATGSPSQPAHQTSLRSPRDEVWGSKGVFDNPFVANPFQADMPAAPPVQRPLSSGPLGRSEGSEMPQSLAADPFAHCSSHPAVIARPGLFQSVSRTEATVPRLQPEEFASPLQSGLRYGIMSHISAQAGFSPGSLLQEEVSRGSSHSSTPVATPPFRVSTSASPDGPLAQGAMQVLHPRRSSSAKMEVPNAASSHPSSPAPARRATTDAGQGNSSSRTSPIRQPVVVPFQGAWPDCASPRHSAQFADVPCKAWQEPGTPSAPGMPSLTSMFYHEPDQGPGSTVSQQARHSSSHANPLGDSVASLTQSRDAGFSANRRVRSPTRFDRPPQPAHHSMPSTVQEEQPGSSAMSHAEMVLPDAASSGSARHAPAQPAHHSMPSTFQERQTSSSSPSQPEAFMPYAASSGSARDGSKSFEPLGRRSSSGNPFKTIRAAQSAERRPSLGNPFAPPEEDADRESNPFKNFASEDLSASART